MKMYKVTNIVYATDGVKVDLPAEMVVECESEDMIADAISDNTGWLVESFKLEKRSDVILDLLMEVRNQAKDAIMDLLKSENVVSINVQPYIQESYITNYAFFDTDKNGNGECLELEMLEKKGNDYVFTMYTNYGDYFSTCKFEDFTTTELFYILEMLEGIFECVENGQPLLDKDEVFDYGEEETEEDN